MIKQALTLSAIVALLSVGSMAKSGATQGKGAKGRVQAPVVLTEAEQEGLIFMAEEEKVARDVYLHLTQTWGADIFSNISASEQRHMDAVEGLLEQYHLPVPSTMDQEGIFENEELQSMYDELIAIGDASLEDAFEVGVTIEETDIVDLDELMADGDLPSDVLDVYGRLLSGSYSHLSAFNKQLAQ